MKPAPQLESTRVLDEGLLLSYFLNSDNNDAHPKKPALLSSQSSISGGHNRNYDSAIAGTTVRFATDTIRTTAEQGMVSSMTPAVCFYPSSAKLKIEASHELPQNLASSGISATTTTDSHSKKTHMHHSFPSFNSMASSLLKDTWPSQTFPTSDSLAANPMHSDESPITPTAYIGFGGQEHLIFPPPIIHGATNPSVDIGTQSNERPFVWGNQPSYSHPLNIPHTTNLYVPPIQPADISSIALSSQIDRGHEAMILPTPPTNATVNANHSSIVNASITDATIEKTSLNDVPKDYMPHIQWLQQINSNVTTLPVITSTNTSLLQSHVMGIATNGPSMQLPSHGNPYGQGQHVAFTTIQAPTMEFVPTVPFLNVLSNIQRDLYSGMNTLKGESEEKRARRLERNRESARQSRRRKKERLIKLSAQVQKLHGEIETERRKQIEWMEAHLRRERTNVVKALLQLQENQDPDHEAGTSSNLTLSDNRAIHIQSEAQRNSNGTTLEAQTDRDPIDINQNALVSTLQGIVESLGPNTHARRAIANFQYQSLKDLILCEYQQFIIWLLVQGETFLTFSRDKHSKAVRTAYRAPSKQIGEALATEQKKTSNAINYLTLNCDAYDSERVWPFLCNELSIGMDQEEKILQTFHSLRESGSLSTTLSHLSLALNVANSLQDGVLYQSHTSTFRSESALLHIMTPVQSALFLQWIDRNRDRIHEATPMCSSRCTSSVSSLKEESDTSSLNSFSLAGDLSIMNELCENLKDSFQLNKE